MNNLLLKSNNNINMIECCMTNNKYYESMIPRLYYSIFQLIKSVALCKCDEENLKDKFELDEYKEKRVYSHGHISPIFRTLATQEMTRIDYPRVYHLSTQISTLRRLREQIDYLDKKPLIDTKVQEIVEKGIRTYNNIKKVLGV